MIGHFGFGSETKIKPKKESQRRNSFFSLLFILFWKDDIAFRSCSPCNTSDDPSQRHHRLIFCCLIGINAFFINSNNNPHPICFIFFIIFFIIIITKQKTSDLQSWIINRRRAVRPRDAPPRAAPQARPLEPRRRGRGRAQGGAVRACGGRRRGRGWGGQEGGGGRDGGGKGGAEGSGADDKVTFKPLGTLLVTVIGAIGLKEKGLSPYCDMRFGNKHARTTVQKDSMAPVWNQTFVFPVNDPHAVLQMRLVSENAILKNCKLGSALVPLEEVHSGVSTGRDQLQKRFALLRSKKGCGILLEVRLVYCYEVTWDFVALFENNQLLERAKRVPEADPEPDISYLTAFKILRGNLYRFLVAIIPFLDLFVFIRGLFAWENPASTLCFLLVMTWTVYHQLLLALFAWSLCAFLALNLISKARSVLRSQTSPSSLTDQVTNADLLDVMRAEVAPVLTRIRRGKPPDTILQDMLTLASIFHAIADASIAFRRLSAVSQLNHDGQQLMWITPEHWKREGKAIAALFFFGLLCLFVPVTA